MERIRAANSNSHNVVSYGWEPAPPVLEVEFGGRAGKPNAIYQYKGVPQSLWCRLLEAPSAGNFLNQYIKPQYECVKQL